jgi:hypothetical protein
MNEEDDRSIRGAIIWAADYRNQNTAALLGRYGVRTFGDLADMTNEQLLKIGLIQDEIYGVTQMLAKRGLLLAKDDTIEPA